MLPIQSVLYEMLPRQNVTIRKCTIQNVTDPDKVLLGDMEQDEIITNISELKKNWFLGMETDPRLKITMTFFKCFKNKVLKAIFKKCLKKNISFSNFRWKESIVREVPNLFSLQVNTTIILNLCQIDMILSFKRKKTWHGNINQNNESLSYKN